MSLFKCFLFSLFVFSFLTSKVSSAASEPQASRAKTSVEKSKMDNGVFFENLKDGQTISTPHRLMMGVRGKTVLSAGQKTEDKNFGHHHLIIGSDGIPESQPIPSDDKHLHFGKGQTETEVNLPPGEHKLTLQFADGAHRSFGPAWSKTITVKVAATKSK